MRKKVVGDGRHEGGTCFVADTFVLLVRLVESTVNDGMHTK